MLKKKKKLNRERKAMQHIFMHRSKAEMEFVGKLN